MKMLKGQKGSIWMIFVISLIHLGHPTEFEIHEEEIPKEITEKANMEKELENANVAAELPVILHGSIVDAVEEVAPTQENPELTAKLGENDKEFHLFDAFLGQGWGDKVKPLKPVTLTITHHMIKTTTVHINQPWTKTKTYTKTVAPTVTSYINVCGTSASPMGFAVEKDIEPTEVRAPNLATVLYDNVIKIKVYDFDPENQLL